MKWIRVEDGSPEHASDSSTPKREEHVVTWGPDGWPIIGWCYRKPDGKVAWVDSDGYNIEVTHWMDPGRPNET